MSKVIEPTLREKELEAEIREKDSIIKGQEGVIRVLERKASPHSLGFYRSRFL